MPKILGKQREVVSCFVTSRHKAEQLKICKELRPGPVVWGVIKFIS